MATSEDSDEESGKPLLTRMKQNYTDTILIGMVILLFVAHIVLGTGIEGWDTITSMYFTVQVFTTIGYGDIEPKTSAMRLVCTVYILFCLVVLAYLLNMKVTRVSEMEESLVKEAIFGDEVSDDATAFASEKQHRQAWKRFLMSSVLFAAFILFGVVFFTIVEDCSCSYGLTLIDGCVQDSFETCEHTKGQVKDFISSFYFSVVTLTTVGFGDFTPQTKVGRWVGIVWMTLGVTSTANWILATQGLIFSCAQTKDSDEQKKTCDALLSELDGDGDGKLTKDEYLAFMLLKHGLASKEVIDKFLADYDINQGADLYG